MRMKIQGEVVPKYKKNPFVFNKPIDQRTFITVYTAGMVAILNLSPAGKRIFILIYNQIVKQKSTDKVILRYQPSYGISKLIWYKGLKECLTSKIIAQSNVAGVFFTNITYFNS